MIWFKCFLTLVFLHVTCALNLCSSQTSCKCSLNSSSTIDLTLAGKVDFPLFLDVSLKEKCDKTELYSYNPCHEFTLHDEHTQVDPKEKPCTGAAACVKFPGGPEGNLPEVHAIGLQKHSIFGIEESGEIYINYTVPGTNRQLKVLLTCSHDEKHLLSIIQPECDGNHQVVLNFTSKCACPNGCPSVSPPKASSGLSTGSKLLITFFTILLAYIIVGVLWNLYNGAQGAELLPNLQFWNELPVLIMEGISFTCSCCGRRPTYSEV